MSEENGSAAMSDPVLGLFERAANKDLQTLPLPVDAVRRRARSIQTRRWVSAVAGAVALVLLVAGVPAYLLGRSDRAALGVFRDAGTQSTEPDCSAGLMAPPQARPVAESVMVHPGDVGRPTAGAGEPWSVQNQASSVGQASYLPLWRGTSSTSNVALAEARANAPSYGLSQQAMQLADARTALALATEMVTNMRCSPTSSGGFDQDFTRRVSLLTKAETVLVMDTFRLCPPVPPGSPDQQSCGQPQVQYTLVTVHDSLVSLAQVSGGPPGIAKADVTGLATVIDQRLSGAHTSPITIAVPTPTPTKGPADPLPPGFLHLSDLPDVGTAGHWSDSRSDFQNSPGVATTLPVCPGSPPVTVTGPVQMVTYRGTVDSGDGEWLLNEEVTTLSVADAAHARHALATLPCQQPRDAITPQETQLLSYQPTRPLIALGWPMGKGNVGFADVYMVVGHQLIHLQAVPGGASGGVILPGGGTWLLTTADAAAQRAQ